MISMVICCPLGVPLGMFASGYDMILYAYSNTGHNFVTTYESICLLHDHPSSFLKLAFYNQVFQPRLFDLQLELADSITNRQVY